MQKQVVVPPNSVQYVQATVCDAEIQGSCVFVPHCFKTQVTMPYVTVQVEDSSICVPVTNLSDNFITLRKGTQLGSIEEAFILDQEPSTEATPMV